MKSIKLKSLTTLLTVFIIPLSFSQTIDTSTMLCPSVGNDFKSSHHFSIGCSIIKWPHDSFMGTPSKTYGVHIELGMITNPGEIFFSNGIGIQGTILSVISGKLSIISYTNFVKYQMCIKPEIGVSIFQFVSFHYGYNLFNPHLNRFNLERHSLSVRIGLIRPIRQCICLFN